MLLDAADPLAVAVVAAIRAGDLDGLSRSLGADHRLAGAGIRDGDAVRSLLHIATDWPGGLPRSPETVALLVAAGADVGARFRGGGHTETPLHWAASNDDVATLDALLDAGADIDADGAVIAGGTPLADAVAFGQWRTARRLLERGARTELWQEAALGLTDAVRNRLAAEPPPDADDVTNAFWCACHGGRQETAALLLAAGADVDRVAYDGLTPLDAAARAGAPDLVEWLTGKGARSAGDLPGG